MADFGGPARATATEEQRGSDWRKQPDDPMHSDVRSVGGSAYDEEMGKRMDREQRGGQVPTGGPARLQPVRGSKFFSRDPQLLALLNAAMDDVERTGTAAGGVDARKERYEATKARERVALLLKDQKTFNELESLGFAGPRYELFCSDLLGYGIPVLKSWLRRGVIWTLFEQRKRSLPVRDVDRRILAEDYDLRQELAYEALARGLRVFRTHALLGEKNRWTAEGKASLMTYFMTAVIFATHQVCRAWLSERRKWDQNTGYGLQLELDDRQAHRLLHAVDADPGEVVVSTQTVVAALQNLPEKTKRVVAQVVLRGDKYAEVALDVGSTERAIEGRLYRVRTELQRRTEARGGRDD